MPSILTQEEVDALLSAVAAGDVSETFGGDEILPRRVRAFDFTGPKPGGGQKALDLVHDQFADFASSTLTALMTLPVVLARTAVDYLPAADYPASVPAPSLVFRVRLTADGPEALVQLGSGTILAMIERLFGGPVVSPIQERKLTQIETSVLRRVVQKLLGDLARAWARYKRLEPEILAVESQPELLSFPAGAAPLARFTFEVRLGETVGLLTVAYPDFFVTKGLDAEEDTREAPPAGEPHEGILIRRVGQAPVGLSVSLGSARLTIRELKCLKVGDVIRLETPVNGTLVASVGARPKFQVRPGQRGQNLAVSIVGACAPVEDN